MSTNQDDLWCPVDEGVPVRIISAHCSRSIDFYFPSEISDRVLHQWESCKNSTDQKWKVERVGAIGYLIRHVESGLCLIPTTLGRDGRVHMDVGPFGHAFAFERQRDSSIRDSIIGKHSIHLAEKKEYTLKVEGSSDMNGAKFILWPHADGSAARWYFKDFHDPN
ncbi:hypothetical protein BC629DRAFT_940686 [Irpex lacteus]|nr:hypothetical protein BC629DRAFT_940686 [Irpex lacteus]